MRHVDRGLVAAVVGVCAIVGLAAYSGEQRDAALELAIEQTACDHDIVAQGTGSVDALATDLLGAPTWSFWWD